MAIGTGIGNIGRLGSGFDRYNAWKSQQYPSTPTSFSRSPTAPTPASPRRTAATGYAGKWETYGNRIVQTEPGRPGTPSSGPSLKSAASRDPISALAAARRSISAAGERYWGKGGPPPSSGTGHRSRFEQFNPTGRPYGHGNPKRLSYQRFTSRWLSPSSPGRPRVGGLTQNPLWGSGPGSEFGRTGAFRGMGGTYAQGQRTGQMGFRRTV